MPPRSRLLRSALWIALLLPAVVVAEEGNPSEAPNSAALKRGLAYFKQALHHVGLAQSSARVERAFADLESVTYDPGDQRVQEGLYLRVWLTPEKFEHELRTQRSHDPAHTTLKELVGDGRLWVTSPGGRRRRMHGTTEGAAAIQQAKNDREHVRTLASMLALKGFKTEGATFEDLGIQELRGRGPVLKVRCQRPQRLPVDFYFSFAPHADGSPRTAMFPVVIDVAGRPARAAQANQPAREGVAREIYVFHKWSAGPRAEGRFPQVLTCYTNDDGEGPANRVFLKAYPRAVVIDRPLPPR